jgi:hypothetical protein
VNLRFSDRGVCFRGTCQQRKQTNGAEQHRYTMCLGGALETKGRTNEAVREEGQEKALKYHMEFIERKLAMRSDLKVVQVGS